MDVYCTFNSLDPPFKNRADSFPTYLKFNMTLSKALREIKKCLGDTPLCNPCDRSFDATLHFCEHLCCDVCRGKSQNSGTPGNQSGGGNQVTRGNIQYQSPQNVGFELHNLPIERRQNSEDPEEPLPRYVEVPHPFIDDDVVRSLSTLEVEDRPPSGVGLTSSPDLSVLPMVPRQLRDTASGNWSELLSQEGSTAPSGTHFPGPTSGLSPEEAHSFLSVMAGNREFPDVTSETTSTR